jgi:hypothetical protein
VGSTVPIVIIALQFAVHHCVGYLNFILLHILLGDGSSNKIQTYRQSFKDSDSLYERNLWSDRESYDSDYIQVHRNKGVM